MMLDSGYADAIVTSGISMYGEPFYRFYEIFEGKGIRKIVDLTKKILSKEGISGFFIFELQCPASFLACVGTLPVELMAVIKRNRFHCSDQVLRYLLDDLSRLPAPIFRSVIDDYFISSPFKSTALNDHNAFARYMKEKQDIQEIYYQGVPHCGLESGAAFCLYGKGDKNIFQQNVREFSPSIGPLSAAFFAAGGRSLVNRLQELAVKPGAARVLRVMFEKDLSAAETARCLGLHEVTVNKHVAAAKKALGATTLGGTAAMAIKEGYVRPEVVC